MTGLGDTAYNLNQLAYALNDIDGQIKLAARRDSVINMPSLEISMTIAEAEERPWREIPLAESLGQVSGEYIMAYPPGVPLSIPGAIITEDTLSCFELRRDNGVKLKFSRSRDSSSVAVL